MAQHTIRLAFAICIALFGGTAFAQDTIGTTAVGTTNYPTSGYELVPNSGITLPKRLASGMVPSLTSNGPMPIPVSENWSIHPTPKLPPGLNSIQVLDSDGANAPLPGFTNQRDVLVVTTHGEPLPDTMDLSEDIFVTSTLLPYSPTLPYTTSRVTDGEFFILVRTRHGGEITAQVSTSGILDTVRPTASMVSIPVIPSATASPTAKIRITTSEPLNHPLTLEGIELTNCTAGPVTQISSMVYEFTITHLAEGQVQVLIPEEGLVDRAGNTTVARMSVTYRYLPNPALISLVVPLVVTGSNVLAQYEATNSFIGVRYVELYSRKKNTDWVQASLSSVSENSFTFVPANGEAGSYYLILRAIDVEGHESAPIPTGMTGTGMKTLHYNPIPNAPASNTVTGSGSYFFAMENDVLVRIDLSNVSGSGTLTVSREEGDLGPFAGTGQMIEERLNIAYAGFTFGDATLETFYEDENLGGLHESSIVTAARVRGASEPTFFPITHDPSWNRVTVNGITSLRDTWYFGRVPSPAANWAMYE